MNVLPACNFLQLCKLHSASKQVFVSIQSATYLILCKIDTSTTSKPNLSDWQTEWKYAYYYHQPTGNNLKVFTLPGLTAS